MARRTSTKGFVKVFLDDTPFIEPLKTLQAHIGIDKAAHTVAAFDCHFRALNPIIYYNGVSAYIPNSLDHNKLGSEVDLNILTESIKAELQAAWENR